MGTPVRPEIAALLVIAVLHLAAQFVHGYGHVVAEVPTTTFQTLFILLVITVGPLIGVFLCW